MPETAYDYIVTAGGIESEKAYPYQSGGAYWDQCRVDAQSAQDCKFDKSKVSATISGYQNVSRKGDENELLQGLVDLGPLSVCVDASTWQTYTKGILTNCPQTLDHCVQLVGYDKTGSTPYWIVRNSWAEYWGIQGYIHVAMGSNQCGIANEATIPISVEVAKNQQNFVLEQIEI